MCICCSIEGTYFQNLMANMEIIPIFGSSFSVYAPLITALIGLMSFFKVYARVLKLIGIQTEDAVMTGDLCSKGEGDSEDLEAGKKLVIGQLRSLGNLLVTEESEGDLSSDDRHLMSTTLSSSSDRTPTRSSIDGANERNIAEGDVELALGSSQDPPLRFSSLKEVSRIISNRDTPSLPDNMKLFATTKGPKYEPLTTGADDSPDGSSRYLSPTGSDRNLDQPLFDGAPVIPTIERSMIDAWDMGSAPARKVGGRYG
jgi:hypothetical protein